MSERPEPVFSGEQRLAGAILRLAAQDLKDGRQDAVQWWQGGDCALWCEALGLDVERTRSRAMVLQKREVAP